MKITQLLDEAKKGVKAPKHTVKPRNFVAKNAIATTSGAGAHKDKKKAAKQGDTKHKSQAVPMDEDKDPCWKDYKQVGMKKKGGKQVPNCVPKESINESSNFIDTVKSTASGVADKVGDTLANALPKEYRPFDNDTAAKNQQSMKVVKNEGNAEYDDEAGMADNNLETLKRAVEGLDDMINEGDNLPEWCQEKIAVAKSMLISVWDYMQSEENSMSENQRNPDLMSQTDYDRYQQGQMDQQKRDFKRDELEHELGHEERGMYYVVIAKNGKWEHTKAQPRQEGMNAAQKIINALHSKYPSMHLGMVGTDGKVYNYGKGK
jgi:hypothetical protein